MYNALLKNERGVQLEREDFYKIRCGKYYLVQTKRNARTHSKEHKRVILLQRIDIEILITLIEMTEIKKWLIHVIQLCFYQVGTSFYDISLHW